MIPIYTQYLNPAEYGTIGVLDFTVSLVGGVVGLRISTAILYFFNAYDKKTDQRAVISTAMIGLFVLSSIIVGFICIFSTEISRIILKDSSLYYYFIIIFITMVFDLTIEPTLVYIRILDKSVLYTAISIVRLTMAVSLNIYFIVFLGYGVLGFLYSGIIVSFITFVFCCLWTFKDTGIRISIEIFKAIAVYSTPLIPASFCMTALHSADTYILSILAGVYSVGLYSLAYKFGKILSDAILTPFGLVWGPMVYRTIKEDNGKEIVARVCTIFCAVLILTGLIIAFSIKDVIRIMADEKFFEAHIAVPFVLSGYIFYAVSTQFHFGSLYKKKTVYTLYANAIAALSNIILNLLIIPVMELKYLGAAITTSISFLILAGCRWFFSNKVFPIQYEIKKMSGLFLVGLGIFLMGLFISFDSYYLNISFKLCLVISYPFSWILFRVFTLDEIKSFCHGLKRKHLTASLDL